MDFCKQDVIQDFKLRFSFREFFERRIGNQLRDKLFQVTAFERSLQYSEHRELKIVNE